MASSKLDPPLAAWFLGPKAENADLWLELINYVFQDYVHWRRNYSPGDPTVISRARRREHEVWWDELSSNLDQVLADLKAHYPFYSPRYFAHMLSEQTFPAIIGYFAGMLYNPNNVTDEAAPVTVQQEIQVGKMVSEMLGFGSTRSWAHLCSGGTVANMEALWVARQVQFVPFVLREYCERYGVAFEVKTANGEVAKLVDIRERELVSLRPNESIFMTRKLARFEIEQIGRERAVVLTRLNEHMRKSRFNVRKRGHAAVHALIGLRPVILVSAAAHYCIVKIAGLLGYGEDVVRTIPVDHKFRMDMRGLREAIESLPDDVYIAAVIGIVGTTEEGAVDPIHEIARLRDELSIEKNRSFWLHLDAAWGGYVRSIFKGFEETEDVNNEMDLQALYDYFVDAINAREHVESLRGGKETLIAWQDPEVYRAFIAMRDADSTTVDPHKMGYVPYPAGIIAFRNGVVTELLAQRAQYISDVQEGVSRVDEMPSISAVGPYVLEGSKPGFVATGCWLAHKCIPLTNKGHGKIIKTSMLNAKKLARYLAHHSKDYRSYDDAVFGDGEPESRKAFTFMPIADPDLNVVCFVTLPMVFSRKKLCRQDVSIDDLNRLNLNIHAELDIPTGERGKLAPHRREFFVSKTRFEKTQYSAKSLGGLLELIGLSKGEYSRCGLVVLRSTVMNPLLYTALEDSGVDYIRRFVSYLHATAAHILMRGDGR